MHDNEKVFWLNVYPLENTRLYCNNSSAEAYTQWQLKSDNIVSYEMQNQYSSTCSNRIKMNQEHTAIST